nr:sensor histidine kinase [Enorma phocaeensis]
MQSIRNLAVISAAVAGGVSLMLTRARRDAELTVRNPCVGLDASETDRLFERFYRPDPSRERGTGGYGIDLSIARSVTERHGGKIRAKKVGDDLEIVVTLPLAR